MTSSHSPSPSADRAPGARRRWQRIVAIVLGVVALLVAAIYAAVSVAFPPERIATLLASQVKQATGRDFRIDGGLSISVVPTIAVRARDVVLGNTDWGSRPDMVRVRNASFEVSPRALLSGELRVLRVDVAGVDALLERDDGGRANWQFAPRTPTAPGPASAGDSSQPAGVELDRLVASDLRLSYRPGGRAKERLLAIESLDLRATGDRDQIGMALVFADQHWKVEGTVGRAARFVAGQEDWPFDLRLASEGATLAASGTLGTGPRTGTLGADVSAKVSTAAALALLGDQAAAVPLPLELRTTLRYGDDKLRADPLHVVLAGQAIDGRATLGSLSTRPRLDAELAANSIDVATLRAGVAAGKPAPVAARRGSALFSDTPLPLDALPPIEMNVDFKIDRLTLPAVPPLSALSGRLTSAPGRLTLDDLQFDLAGGQVRGRMAIALAAGTVPKIEMAMEARSLSLEALDAASGGKRVRGGRAQLAAKLALAGRTPHSLAAGANGNVLLTVADVTLAGGSAAALDRNVIASVLRVVLPTGAGDQSLVVQCAIANLPLRQGVAAVDRSIAVETREVAIVASGRINFVDETLGLEFASTVKKGLGLNPANFSEFVKVSGPILDPHVGVDVKGAARGAANVGVAVATGGLSLLAPRALGGAKDAPPCGQGGSAAPANAAPAEKKRGFLGLR